MQCAASRSQAGDGAARAGRSRRLSRRGARRGRARPTTPYAWIKALRHARVDGAAAARPVHVPRRLAVVVRRAVPAQGAGRPRTSSATVAALDALLEREQPAAICARRGGPADRARSSRRSPRGAACRCSGPRRPAPSTRAASPRWTRARSWLARGGARLATASPRARRPPASARPRSLAFVHRAFWRSARRRWRRPSRTSGRSSQRSSARLPDGGIRYVGVGPAANFRARRWWHPVIAGARRRRPSPDRGVRVARSAAGRRGGSGASATRSARALEQRRAPRDAP